MKEAKNNTYYAATCIHALATGRYDDGDSMVGALLVAEFLEIIRKFLTKE